MDFTISSLLTELMALVAPYMHFLSLDKIKAAQVHNCLLLQVDLVIHLLPKLQHVPLCKQFGVNTLSNSFPCDICVYARMHILPLNKIIITTSSLFQLIHLDI